MIENNIITDALCSLDDEIAGKSRGEIWDLYNEIRRTTSGSIIDGVKIGYLYCIVNVVE
jgi:hypothetical protein